MKNKDAAITIGVCLTLGLLFMVAIVRATTTVYNQYFVNETALAVSKTYTLDLRTAGANTRSIDTVAATAATSSSTIPSVSFTDGQVSTGSITVTSTNTLVSAAATDNITVVTTQTLANARVYVTGSNGQPRNLRAGYDWFVGTGTAVTATSLAKALNTIAGIQASATSNVVYATATVAGSAGNSFTITESGVDSSTLTIASANFTGGANAATVSINGTKLTFGTDISTASLGSVTAVANAIAAGINANSTLSAIVTATNTAGVVFATANVAGVNAYALSATPTSSLTVGGATFTNGLNLSWVLNGSNINVPNHGLSTGLGVLYSTGVVAISGLTNQTTYYAIRVDANNFQLASTSTGAVAGNGLVLASSTTTGGHTYTLAPLATAGTFSYKWQSSDDNVTWTDMAVSSVTFASPYTSTTTAWDFGTVNHRYIRLNEVAGTAGGISLQIALTGKNSN